MQELRDRLAAEINKNEGLSMKLELSEKLRLKSEIEKTGDEHSVGLDNISDVAQGRVCDTFPSRGRLYVVDLAFS